MIFKNVGQEIHIGVHYVGKWLGFPVFAVKETKENKTNRILKHFYGKK